MTSKNNFVTIFIFALFLFSMAAWALEILIQKILETILVETGKSKMNQVLIEMRITQESRGQVSFKECYRGVFRTLSNIWDWAFYENS